MNVWKGQVDHSKSLKRPDYWIGTLAFLLIGGCIFWSQQRKLAACDMTKRELKNKKR